MITFRYHIVSLVSVFLALAVGVALGGGPLKGEVDNSIVQELAASKKRTAELRAQVREDRLRSEFTDQVVAETGPRLLRDALSDVPVAVVTVPGAVSTSVTRVSDAVEAAGGTVTGTYRLSTKLADPGDRTLLDQLTSQLSADVDDLSLPSEGDAYERAGALLARAIATPDAEAVEADDASRSIVSGLATGGVLLGESEVRTRARAIVLVAGNPPEDLVPAYAALSTGLAGGSAATVVAGPVTAAQADGLLRDIRNDATRAQTVSTVDSVTTAVGGVIAVLAVRQGLTGDTGHYGAVGAVDGALPAIGPDATTP